MVHTTLILDLGDVVFHWSAGSVTAIPPSSMKAAMSSTIWSALERGEVEESDAYNAIGTELGIRPTSISRALDEARQTLTVDSTFIQWMKDLKSSLHIELKVYAMTNIAKNDFAVLKTVLDDWTVFDDVFTSFETGMRKPDPRFYKYVLEQTEAVAERSIFIDDKELNVSAARSLGITGIVFESKDSVMSQLNTVLRDPVSRGKAYLKQHSGHHHSSTEDGKPIWDYFSQFLILEATGDRSLLIAGTLSDTNLEKTSSWNYFIGDSVGTSSVFPDDVDTTACSLLGLAPQKESANKVLDLMLANRNRDGLILTYFDPTRPRIDPVVIVNVLRAFYKYDRGDDILECLDYVKQTLDCRSYVNGTRHYLPPAFLFFLSRLIAENPSAGAVQELHSTLKSRVQEHIGQKEDAFAVATRILTCQTLGLDASTDLKTLKTLQDDDGAWKRGWLCRFGKNKKRIENMGLTTVYAVMALQGGQW